MTNVTSKEDVCAMFVFVEISCEIRSIMGAHRFHFRCDSGLCCVVSYCVVFCWIKLDWFGLCVVLYWVGLVRFGLDWFGLDETNRRKR